MLNKELNKLGSKFNGRWFQFKLRRRLNSAVSNGIDRMLGKISEGTELEMERIGDALVRGIHIAISGKISDLQSIETNPLDSIGNTD